MGAIFNSRWFPATVVPLGMVFLGLIAPGPNLPGFLGGKPKA